MTDISYVRETGNVGNEFRTKALQGRARVQGFRVENTYWGYIIHGDGSANWTMVGLQILAMIVGAACIVASFVLIAVPTVLTDEFGLMVRTGSAAVFAMLAIFMIWFASRGTVTEVHVDIHQGEVREALRNRTGRATILGRHGVDAIGGVFLDRTMGRDGEASLVLRYRNTAKTLLIAEGRAAPLEKLKNRLGRDLILT